jgi:hypothetical protein
LEGAGEVEVRWRQRRKRGGGDGDEGDVREGRGGGRNGPRSAGDEREWQRG